MNKIINILILVLLGSLCISNGFSIDLSDGVILSYTNDNTEIIGSTLFDLSSTSNDGTIYGATCGVIGQINEACNFNGSNKIESDNNIGITGSEDRTFSMWVKMSSTSGQYLLSTGGATNALSGKRWTPYFLDSDTINVNIKSGNAYFTVGDIGDNTWHHLVFGLNGTKDDDIFLYLDGVEVIKDSSGGTIINSDDDIVRIGYDLQSESYFDGAIDEIIIWNRTLSSTEVTELYNSGDGLQYPFIPKITTNIQDFYKLANISINLTTSENTNMGYKLDNFALPVTEICNNCSNATLALFNLSEGSHSILFVSFVENGQNFSHVANFTIDTTNPSLNDSLNNLELNNFNYSFSSSQYVNFNDNSGVSSCIINYTTFNQNSLCNATSHTFNYNGYTNYTITLIDNANNTNTSSGTIFNNPKQIRYFSDINGNRITNFTFGGIFYTDYAEINVYNLGLGNHTLLFDKATFELTSVNFTFTNTSKINATTVIAYSKINVNIFDRDTLSALSQLVNLELLNNGGSSFGAIFNTSTGNYTYINSNFTSGNYILRATSQDYNGVEYYFTYSGQENASINLYMLQGNKTDDNNEPVVQEVKIVLQDLAGFNVGESYIVKVLQQYASEDGSTFIVDSGKTNAQGEVLLNLEYNSIFYSIIIEYQGETLKKIDTFKITKYGTNCNLGECYYFSIGETVPSGDSYASYDNIDFNLRYVNLTNSSGYIQFTFNDNDNLVGGFCLDTYQKVYFDWTLIDTSCLSAASGVISTIINGTDDSSFKAIGYIQDDSTTLGTIYVEDKDLALEWGIYGLVGTIILFFVVIGIGSYAASKNIQDAPAITLALMVGVMWATDTLQMVSWSYTILFSLTLILGVIVWLLYRQK